MEILNTICRWNWDTGEIQDNLIEVINGGVDSTFSAFRLNGAVEAGDNFQSLLMSRQLPIPLLVLKAAQ